MICHLNRTLLMIILGICSGSYTEACTNIQIKADDQSLIVGRTMEFGPDLESRLISSPRHTAFTTSTANGIPTKHWISKYGYLLADYFNTGFTVDGMNEQGLSFGYLYLPGYTTFPTLVKGQEANALPYDVFGDWVLGNFSQTDEVETALKELTVYVKPLPVPGSGSTVFPVHAIITDKEGKSIVVEFIDGKMMVSKNPLGILTNSPDFAWHLKNLKNYMNLSANTPKPIVVDGISYAVTCQGSGLVGLPGDPTPPSRFVKMAVLQQTALPVPDAVSALILAKHILNNVDIPYGLVRGPVGSSEVPENIDRTQWTVFKDLTHHILYFSSYDNPTIQSIDMNKIDFTEGAKKLALPLTSKVIIPDATAQFIQSAVNYSAH